MSKNSNESGFARWAQTHPRLAPIVASVIGLTIILAIFLVIGINESHKAINPATGAVNKSWMVKSVGMIGVALFAVWKGRRDMRKH
jgi:hypothetical protein